jgi:hypothetical protein
MNFVSSIARRGAAPYNETASQSVRSDRRINMRHLKWIMLVVVVLSLMLAPAALAAPAPQYGQCGYWYQVRWGNTLSSISRYTGVSTWAIAQANGLANPHYIYAGQWLWI